MNTALWIVAGLLAFLFLVSGAVKLTLSRERLVGLGFGWVDDVSGGAVKALGILEILGAIGLILPAAVDVVPVLVPLAAVGLAVLMIGAMVTHLRRREAGAVVVALILLALAAFVVWGRFGAEPFTG